MKIVIDMQGAQSTGSKNRGIGRYTVALVNAIIKLKGDDVVVLVFSDAFPETILPLKEKFKKFVPEKNMHVWHCMDNVLYLDSAFKQRRQAMENLREVFLSSLEPDILLITSMFEGGGDSVIVSTGRTHSNYPTAVILYDLIPYLYQDIYLPNDFAQSWYGEKLNAVRRCELCLAISESTRQEAINEWQLPQNQVVNISGAIDDCFKPIEITKEQEQEIRTKFEISKPFIMYTGGIDSRKNIEGLIRAFAILPESIQLSHQIVIVCSASATDIERLTNFLIQSGLKIQDVVFTGYVSEQDLVKLYNLAKVFVFPSWHEGFGLPVLEAMSCGRAVIASDNSSLPEIIGRQEALFDARDDKAISKLLLRVLTDQKFRGKLEKHGLKRAKKFSWDASGQKALSSMRTIVANAKKHTPNYTAKKPRKKLALVSPLPPQLSGIADYSDQLIEALALHYDIDLLNPETSSSISPVKGFSNIRNYEWFLENGNLYDRIVYQFGNSTFHTEMLELTRLFPGVAVLHDFFFGDLYAHLETVNIKSNIWVEALYHSHGYVPIRKRYLQKTLNETKNNFPVSLEVIQKSLGIISHSQHSLDMGKLWYGSDVENMWSVVKFPKDIPRSINRNTARKRFDLNKEVVICSFGILAETKCTDKLISAWANSELANNDKFKLVLVGHLSEEYINKIQKDLNKTSNIIITNHVPEELYKAWLSAADIAVQLRKLSRGETSAALFDCLSYGLPTIINNHGALTEIPKDVAFVLEDDFSPQNLIEAILYLSENETDKKSLSQAGQKHIKTKHSSAIVAKQYYEAIERFYDNAKNGLYGLLKSLDDSFLSCNTHGLWEDFANAAAKTFPPCPRRKQVFMDFTLANTVLENYRERTIELKKMLNKLKPEYRFEPIFIDENSTIRYARKLTLRMLECPQKLEDTIIEYHSGDIFLMSDDKIDEAMINCGMLEKMRIVGVEIKTVCPNNIKL